MNSPNKIRWITDSILAAIHSEVIAEHGGLPGIRDENSLASAVARPRHVFEYEADPSIPQLAATLGYGIARNHPFVDGNKRVALMAIYVFLRLNSHRLITSEYEAVIAMQKLASGKMTEAELTEWIENNVEKVTV
jgi:death-on-curing protein